MKRLVGVLAMLISFSAFATEEEWKAVGGVTGIFNSGNSESQNIGGNALVQVKKDANQLGWNANGAYGRAKDSATGVSSINTENWMTQARYDRFITKHFSFYTLGHMNHDAPAGFDFNYGASSGIANYFLENKLTTLKYEVGFDFTRQRYVTRVENDLYSGRFYLQYTHKFSETAFFSQDMENLFNLTDKKDYRVNALTAINFKLTQKFAFQTGCAIRFDNEPVPTFKKLDTTTTVGININFL